MNALMHNGHRNENPRVPISTPYDMARKKKLMQIGSTLGNAALNARVFTPPFRWLIRIPPCHTWQARSRPQCLVTTQLSNRSIHGTDSHVSQTPARISTLLITRSIAHPFRPPAKHGHAFDFKYLNFLSWQQNVFKESYQ